MSQTVEIELLEIHRTLLTGSEGTLARQRTKRSARSTTTGNLRARAPRVPGDALSLSFRKLIKLSRRFQWPQHPEGPALAVGRMLVGRSRLVQPLLVNLA